MDVFAPECPYLQSGLRLSARRQQWRQTLALPEEAGTYLLEVAKFLACGALILATGALLLLLLG